MTIAMLMQNTVRAAELASDRPATNPPPPKPNST